MNDETNSIKAINFSLIDKKVQLCNENCENNSVIEIIDAAKSHENPNIEKALNKCFEACINLQNELQKSKCSLRLISVKELLGEYFFIPDYQRGYRWTKYEVAKLVDDLYDFFKTANDEDFYCMQPLVVKKNNSKNAWEVIDGQQRLTTIFIFLKILNESRNDKYKDFPFKLSYQSREDSTAFLKDLNESAKYHNIDYFHIYNAYKTIKDLISEKIFDFNKVLNMVKFIWYDIRDKSIKAEEKFAALNIGKINLTNSELIKALFLNNLDEEIDKIKIASEWDNFENSFHKNNLWSFIYGEEDGKYDTRIEILFDLYINNQNEPKIKNSKDPYKTFELFSMLIEKTNNEKKNLKIKEIWKEISNYYYNIKNWYEDKNLYHIIGYLRYLKIDIYEIFNIFNKSDNDNDFFKQLKRMAINKTLKANNETNLESAKVNIDYLSYRESKDRKHIKNILLLFNILSVLECEKLELKFSFESFYNKNWDLEHIRSQTPKDIKGQDRLDWINCNLFYLTGKYYSPSSIDSYNKVIQECKDSEIKGLCQELLELSTQETDITQSKVYENLKKKYGESQELSDIDIDGIGNLVLLDQTTNRGYGNAFFPVKRSIINNKEKEGEYILPCTKNVFSKCYSSSLYDLTSWSKSDSLSYLEEINRVLGVNDGKI